MGVGFPFEGSYTHLEDCFMRNLFIAIFLFLLPLTTYAASYTVTCDPPTARTDGTPFDAATELKQYNWYVDGALDGNSTECRYTVMKPDGTYAVTAASVDTDNQEGPESVPFTLTLKTAPPNPPSGLR